MDLLYIVLGLLLLYFFMNKCEYKEGIMAHTCENKLNDLCGKDKSIGIKNCGFCTGLNKISLHAEDCTDEDMINWCRDASPDPPPSTTNPCEQKMNEQFAEPLCNRGFETQLDCSFCGGDMWRYQSGEEREKCNKEDIINWCSKYSSHFSL